MRKRIIAVILACMLVLSLIGVSVMAAPKPVILKLADNQPADNPVNKGNYFFAERVKELTNGQVIVEVYPGAVLGEEVDVTQQVRAGIIAMARINTVPLAEFVPEIGVVTLPYVFASFEHKWKVLDSEIGQSLLKSFEKAGLVGLNFYEAGFRHFYTTKKPIRSVADLKGMKIRVQQSRISMKMVELLGAVPTPMNYGDVYSALQTGVIDGAENDFVSYNLSSHYEVAKNITLDGHLSPPAVIIMNKAIFDKLPKEHQQAILQAAKEASKFQRNAMEEFQNESRKKVEAAGCKVYTVNVTEFQKAVQPIYDMYPEYKEVLAKIRAMQ